MKKQSKYLMKEEPLIIDKTLGSLIGLNEAIILQQIEYWLTNFKKTENKRHYRDCRWWVYNSYEKWKANFPFWSKSTIRRTIKRLEEKDILITANYNRIKMDRTKWYSIDYKKLDDYCNKAIAQNEQLDCSKRTTGNSNLNRPIPKITSETTSKTNKTYMVPKKSSEAMSAFLSLYEKYTNEKHKAIEKDILQEAEELMELIWAEKISSEHIIEQLEKYFNNFNYSKGFPTLNYFMAVAHNYFPDEHSSWYFEIKGGSDKN